MLGMALLITYVSNWLPVRQAALLRSQGRRQDASLACVAVRSTSRCSPHCGKILDSRTCLPSRGDNLGLLIIVDRGPATGDGEPAKLSRFSSSKNGNQTWVQRPRECKRQVSEISASFLCNLLSSRVSHSRPVDPALVAILLGAPGECWLFSTAQSPPGLGLLYGCPGCPWCLAQYSWVRTFKQTPGSAGSQVPLLFSNLESFSRRASDVDRRAALVLTWIVGISVSAT